MVDPLRSPVNGELLKKSKAWLPLNLVIRCAVDDSKWIDEKFTLAPLPFSGFI
jgi:hypothetical protein